MNADSSRCAASMAAGKRSGRGAPGAGERGERPGKHPADVVLGVVHDAPRDFVPEHRHGDAARGNRLGGGVGLAEKGEAFDRVVAVAGAIAKRPAALVADGIDHGAADGVLEPQEMPHDDRAAGPRAGQRDVKMIAARFRRKRAWSRPLETQSRKASSCRSNSPSSFCSSGNCALMRGNLSAGANSARANSRGRSRHPRRQTESIRRIVWSEEGLDTFAEILRCYA